MKAWLISDTHFGKYSTKGDKWMDMMKEYFYDFFIPTLKKYSKPDDKLFMLGDLFDNRTSLDMRAINLAINIFEDLSKIVECHVLLGNHDQRMMKDPTINSIITIKNLPNVYTYIEPTKIELDGKMIGLMPWLNDKEDEVKTLKKFNGFDYVFCHSDLNGCRTQLYPTRPKNKEILDIEDFVGIGRVFSGHIHIRQTINNFTFVGSPYQLDRNDIDNRKGIHIIDMGTGKELFLENDYSPEFIKVEVNKLSDLDTLKKECDNPKNNYIDLEISKKLLSEQPHIKLEIDKLDNKTNISRIEQINDIVKEKKETDIKYDTKNKTIKDISLEYIDEIEMDDSIDFFDELEFKKKLKDTVKECFEIDMIKK